LKPTSTVSEKKLTAAPARSAYARNARPATITAVHAASAAARVTSPPAIAPRLTPTSIEMAEVTVTAVCVELQKIQKTRPAKRQEYSPACGGRPASDASPIAAGTRYAASVMPATMSPRSQVLS
jgi:hypothetical protein